MLEMTFPASFLVSPPTAVEINVSRVSADFLFITNQITLALFMWGCRSFSSTICIRVWKGIKTVASSITKTLSYGSLGVLTHKDDVLNPKNCDILKLSHDRINWHTSYIVWASEGGLWPAGWSIIFKGITYVVGNEVEFSSVSMCVALCSHVDVLIRFMIFIMNPCIRMQAHSLAIKSPDILHHLIIILIISRSFHIHTQRHICTHSGTLLPCLVPMVHSESPGINPGFTAATAEREGGGVSRQRDASSWLWSLLLQGVSEEL